MPQNKSAKKQSDLSLHAAAHFALAVILSYPSAPLKNVSIQPPGQCFPGSHSPSTSKCEKGEIAQTSNASYWILKILPRKKLI